MGLRLEKHLALLQEIGTVGRIPPVVLGPGPVVGPPVPVGHTGREQEDVRAVTLEDPHHRLMVD